ncbi:MotA/TolQ/ExbB proton channel family protein [Emcibacter sp. SYSU 3D8]|uniref:MotA/TolQ/ExbB proton channel family protein n=1 Tax=Emcibacter sp. SYSU 3D8 TaxID=3133969 RepID=UPI0031FF3DBE
MNRLSTRHWGIRAFAPVALALALVVAPVASGIALAQDAEAPAAEAPADEAPVMTDPAATAEPAAPMEAAPIEDTGMAEVENPYGLKALWEQGDLISKGTLIILVIMSMGTWYIMFTKVWDQAKLFSQAKQVDRDFWKAPSLQEGLDKLDRGNQFRSLIEKGLGAAQHHEGRLTDQIDAPEWIANNLQRESEAIQMRLQGGLAFLATVGSTAPFVGLFGTVWGIYHALIAIGVAGQASIDKVAGPVGEALIMTAIGLAVAVPAVLAYNWLVRRNKAATEIVRNFVIDYGSYLVQSRSATARSH